MIQGFNRNDRRILTFPAVHPCVGIHPTTLLESLITLSHSICSYQSKLFPTQKRNARETIRIIGILLIFFEEIRDHGSILSDSIVLCFSELHFSLQKIQFLLEDITREDARLWILMKAHFVATQFRILIRTMATALDVLPLDAIFVSCEIKELVELVAKQTRKAKFELHLYDESSMKEVILILNQFEHKFKPGLNMIKQVLDYLDIRSWSDCHNEIKFLGEEIRSEFLGGSEREVPLLSSLIGLMSYCRGVLFENSNFGNIDQSYERCNYLEKLNPEDFRCPISLELMTDPVTISTGQTYDRDSIQKWFESGKLVCPKTGEKLTSIEMVPNSSLGKIIQQYIGISFAKSRKNNRNKLRTIDAGSPAAAEAINFLSEFLADRLNYGTDEEKKKAAYEIRLLAKSNIFNRYCLIRSNTIPLLFELLNSMDSSVQENAIAALLKLSKHSNGKKAIMDHGGLKLILPVLKTGLKMEARQTAAATIFYLSSVHEYRRLIGETPETIPSLVELIKDGKICGKKKAVIAIFGLLLHPKNHQRVLAAGAIPLLVDLIASSDNADLITDSLAVLATLAESTGGSISILQTSALPVIMGFFNTSTSQSGKEYCVSILLSLCINCGVDFVGVLAKDPSLMHLLYLLLTDGTSHAGKKARLLIKILHKFNEEQFMNVC